MAKKAPAKKTKSTSTSTSAKPAAKSPSTSKAKKPLPKTKAVEAEIVEHDEEVEFRDISERNEEERVAPIEAEVVETDTDLPLPISSGTKTVSTTHDPLAMYLAEIRKYPLLTREEELELAKKYYETKDPEAAQKLVRSNLRFVVKVAAEYSKFSAKMIDLIQEGNVGLMHAVREFNPYKGARLITYAVWWIKGYIQEYLMRQYSMVRIGTTQNQRKLFYQLQKEKEALEAMGAEPNIALLSDRLGIPEDEVTEMAKRMSGRDVSLDRPLDEDGTTSLADLLRRDDGEIPVDERIALEEQLASLKESIESLRPELSEKEKIILDERLLSDEPLTLQEIGEKYKITREAVRQTEVRVLNKIKAKLLPST